MSDETPRECNDCGGTEWNETVELEVDAGRLNDEHADPATVRTIMRCDDCGAWGKKCIDGKTGGVTYTGAMR